MPEATSDWSTWLVTWRRPVLFAFGGEWQSTSWRALEAMAPELRELGALVVVAAGNTAFCVGADDVPSPVPSLDRRGFELLYRAIRVDPGDRFGQRLTLTLIDHHGKARMKTTWPEGDEPSHIVASILACASRSLAETTTPVSVTPGGGPRAFTRREHVVLSLIGALAMPFAAGFNGQGGPATRPSERPPAASDRSESVSSGEELHPLQAALETKPPFSAAPARPVRPLAPKAQ